MTEREDRDQLLGPPQSSATNRTPLKLIMIGVAVAAALLLGVFFIDVLTGTTVSKQKRLVDLDAIAVPSNPTSEEINNASDRVDKDSLAALKEGAWIQVAGEKGQLAQEYSAKRIDPLPDQWVDMAQPHALMYPSSGRIISLTADQGRAHVPARAIESGTFTGNVKIRIFEALPSGRRTDIAKAVPSVVVNADVAEFDNVQDEITSPRSVRVSTEQITFVGEGLSIQLGEQGAGIERLIVDRATEPIRIVSNQTTAPSELTTESNAPLAPSGDATASAQASAEAESPSSVAAVGGQDAAPDAEADSPTWYRLVLHDDILIERFGAEDGQRSTVKGDQLVATFALGEGGIEAPLARRPPSGTPVPDTALAVAMRQTVFIASAATGGVIPQDAPLREDGLVLVHYSGRLIMTPDPSAASRMASRDDAEIVVEGLKGRGITVRDDANEADVSCARLRYQAKRDTVELIGDEVHPLRLESPRMQLAGGRFWYQRSTAEGGIIGPGTMTLVQGATSLQAALNGVPLAVSLALADARMESRALMEAAVMCVHQDAQSEDPGLDLEITWQEGIDLDFTDMEEASRIKQARFRGEVNVVSPDFNLTSETLAVDFSDDPEQEDAVERIVAGGGARVLRLGESGSLAAQTIDLSLEETPEGRTVPTIMKATGGVEASDPSQKMWSERLVVHFEPAPEETGADEPARPQRGFAGGLSDGEMGSVQITTVDAQENVQVRLKDGARVFAERLNGDAVKRNLDLVGDNVMLLRDNVIADKMQEVKIDDENKTVRGMGPGRFRYFQKPIAPESSERIVRPAPTLDPSLAATWRDSMTYSEDVNDGAGRLDLSGKVRVRTESNPRETGRLDAENLRLDLVRREDDQVKETGTAPEEDAGRDLKKMTATGDAIMESRTWETPTQKGEPQLFRITGDHVEYEPLTREALVKGPGSLLVHDPRAQDAPAEEADSDGPVGVFGVDGTSRFKWKESMAMRREVDERYLITMKEDVEVLHAGLQENDTFSMTGDELQITVERPDQDPEEGQSDTKLAAEKEDQGLNSVDLGGPANMLRVRGIGHVFVRTPEQDVDCEEFDYNVETQIAMLKARPGRVVTIQPKNSATPIRAALVQWDLRTGRMRILSGEGGIAR